MVLAARFRAGGKRTSTALMIKGRSRPVLDRAPLLAKGIYRTALAVAGPAQAARLSQIPASHIVLTAAVPVLAVVTLSDPAMTSTAKWPAGRCLSGLRECGRLVSLPDAPSFLSVMYENSGQDPTLMTTPLSLGRNLTAFSNTARSHERQPKCSVRETLDIERTWTPMTPSAIWAAVEASCARARRITWRRELESTGESLRSEYGSD